MIANRQISRQSAYLLLPVILACMLPISVARAQDFEPLDALDRFEIRGNPLPRFARPGIAERLAPLDRMPTEVAPLSTTAFTKPGAVQQARSHDAPPSGGGGEAVDRPATTAAVSGTASGATVSAARKVGRGRATFYEHNGRTASGERYKPDGLTAAHHSLPLGSRVRVVNEQNGKSVEVRINDRTNEATNEKRPYVIDLSRGAARALDIEDTGSVGLYRAQ